MPFVFQVAKIVLSHSERKVPFEDELDELEQNNWASTEDYGTALLEQAQQYFTQLSFLHALPDSNLLIDYLKQIVAIKADSNESASTILEAIFKDSMPLLRCEKNIKALIQVLIIAYNQVVISQKAGSYVTEEAQVKYIESVKNRLSIMSHILGMFPTFFHESAEFSEDRIALLSSLFEDVGVQLGNIGYGLYYRAYTTALYFSKLEYFFYLAAGVGETFATGVCLRIQKTASTELSRLLPVFDYLMNKNHYMAAFSFALGNDKTAHARLEDVHKNNVEVKTIFDAMHPKRDVFYKAVLTAQADKTAVFNLDNPFQRYRKMCSEILKAVHVVQAPTIVQTHKFGKEEHLVNALEALRPIEKLSDAPIVLIKKSFVFLEAALEHHSDALNILVAAHQTIQELDRLFRLEAPNPILVRVQDYITQCKAKISTNISSIYNGFVGQQLPSINEETRASKSVDSKEAFDMVLPAGTVLTVKRASKSHSNASKTQKPCEKQVQEKLEKIKEECLLAEKELEQVQQDMQKVIADFELAKASVQANEGQDKQFQSQLTPLQAELEALSAQNMELDKKLKIILHERAKSTLTPKKDIKALEDKAQHQITMHKQIIQDLQCTRSSQLLALDAEFQKVKTALHVLQQQEQHHVKAQAQALESLKNKHKKQLDMPSERARMIQEIETENTALQSELAALQKQAHVQTKGYQDEIQELAKFYQLQRTQAKDQLVKSAQMLNDSRLKEQASKIEAENAALVLKIEQLKKLHKEQYQRNQEQYQLLGNTHRLENESFETNTKILGAGLEQIQAQLKTSELSMRVSSSMHIEFAGDLSLELDQNPLMLKECLSLYLQLSKSACESDCMIIHQNLVKVLSTKELRSYLAIFCAIVNHPLPSYSFKKAYHTGIIAQLIPLKWPFSTDGIIQNWLDFVNMKLQNTSLPINPYLILNLILIAPYYALGQTKSSVSHAEIIEETADKLLGHLPNLSVADKNLLKRNIEIGLQSLCVEFQKWINPCDSTAMLCPPAPVLISDMRRSLPDTALSGSLKNSRQHKTH